MNVTCATLKQTCVYVFACTEAKRLEPLHLVQVSRKRRDLDALGRMLDLVDGAARGGGRVGLGELILSLGAVDALLEDGVDLVHVELGLEVSDVGVARGVGTPTRVGKVELVIDDLVTGVSPMNEKVSGCSRWSDNGEACEACIVAIAATCTVEFQLNRTTEMRSLISPRGVKYGIKRHIPIGLATTTLLDLFGILANMTVLGEEARKMLFWSGSAVSQTGVVLVVVLKGH